MTVHSNFAIPLLTQSGIFGSIYGTARLKVLHCRRQQPIEIYIVDFVSLEKRIVIELDGGQHAETESRDQQRDGCLAMNGFTVLRF